MPGLGLEGPGPRAVSLSAPLLALTPVAPLEEGGAVELMSPSLRSPSPVPRSPEEVFVPGTPGMDDVPVPVSDCGGAAAALCVKGMAVAPAELNDILETPETGDVHMGVCVSAASESCVSRARVGVRVDTLEVEAASGCFGAGAA